MVEYKRCQICGKVISSIHDIGFNRYRHIRIKYCDTCREFMNTIQNRNKQYNFRERQKVANGLKEKRQSLLEEENKLLRERVLQLQDDVDMLKRMNRSWMK